MNQVKTTVFGVIIILIAVSIAGGLYFGYQTGYDNSRKTLEPQLQEQINLNANVTRQNQILDRALHNASNLGTVKIGYLASSLTDRELTTPFINEIVQPDLNAYASKLGYNVTFQFVIPDVVSTQPGEHLTKIQELKKEGVDLVISGGWSSMLSTIQNYVDDRNMLLVGTTSTSPYGLAIPNDRLYRMNPPDSTLPSQLASIMWSYGVKTVIIIQRGDSWGDGVAQQFETAWNAKGGALAGQAIRYPAEETDFSGYLQSANRQAEAAKLLNPDGDQVAILLLAYGEDVAIVTEMANYLPLYDCVLFSGYSHVGLKMDGFLGNPQANHLKIFTPAARPFRSSHYEGLKARYTSIDEQDAFLYDSAWAIAVSVLETRSGNASVVNGVFSDVCGRLYGASGWCRLDRNGDRASLPMDVWFYSEDSRHYAGFYEPDTDRMNWNIVK